MLTNRTEAIIERDYILEQLQSEKQDLEEKVTQLFNDAQLAQEHRKRMEKSYQNVITLLDEKVSGLNIYIEELEARSNQRIRSSITPEVSFCFFSLLIGIEKKQNTISSVNYGQ